MFLFPSEEDSLSFFSVGFHGCGDPVLMRSPLCPPNFFPLGAFPTKASSMVLVPKSFDWMSTVVASSLILYVCLLFFSFLSFLKQFLDVFMASWLSLCVCGWV